MSDFTPTAFRVEQKGARMVAIYATVAGEEVFVGSSLNGGGFDAADKVAWMVVALESHHGLTAGTAKKAKAAAPSPKKAAGTSDKKSLVAKKKIGKK